LGSRTGLSLVVIFDLEWKA